MIPLLLWRCPLCVKNEALSHVARRFRADRVRCRCCGADWRVRRVPGDGFYLKLIRAGDGHRPDSIQPGNEQSLAAWYDSMKATVHLEPLPDKDGVEAGLIPGEVLYLASGPAELWAEETDPLFFSGTGPGDTGRVDKGEIRGRQTGRGRLLLTDRRLIWQGTGRPVEWPLDRVNSAYAFLDEGVMLMVELRLYTVYFLAESLLKWIAYLALVSPQVEARTGHRIVTSHW